jgi:ribosomal protein S18 acetylase RimI-like enzyme
MKIRPFKESDAVAVAKLSNANSEFFQYLDVKPEYLKCMCMSPYYKMLILDDAGKVKGFCGVNYSNRCIVEIGPICVSKALRDKGFGHKLVSRAIKQLDKMNPPHVIIKVKASNTNGQDFFRSLGFSPIESVEVNGEPAIVMEML